MTDPAELCWCNNRRNHLTSSAPIIRVLLVALIRSLDLYSGVISGILRDNNAKLTPNSPRSTDRGPGIHMRPSQTHGVGVIHGVTTSPPPHQSSEFNPDTDSPCQPRPVA